jgi:hypothetical protein
MVAAAHAKLSPRPRKPASSRLKRRSTGFADSSRDRREELGQLVAVRLLQVNHLGVVLQGAGALAAPRAIPVAWRNALLSLVVVAGYFSSLLDR